MGHSNNMCTSYTTETETLDHLFCTCSFAARYWADLINTISNAASGQSLQMASSFLDLLDNCLHTSPTHTIRLIVLFKMVWYIWKQQNGDSYQGKFRVSIPIIPITKALHLMEVTLSASKGKNKCMRLRAATNGLRTFLDPLALTSFLGGGTIASTP